jgi:hypothetical protein
MRRSVYVEAALEDALLGLSGGDASAAEALSAAHPRG